MATSTRYPKLLRWLGEKVGRNNVPNHCSRRQSNIEWQTISLSKGQQLTMRFAPMTLASFDFFGIQIWFGRSTRARPVPNPAAVKILRIRASQREPIERRPTVQQ
jgi:hypothetical protein